MDVPASAGDHMHWQMSHIIVSSSLWWRCSCSVVPGSQIRANVDVQKIHGQGPSPKFTSSRLSGLTKPGASHPLQRIKKVRPSTEPVESSRLRFQKPEITVTLAPSILKVSFSVGYRGDVKTTSRVTVLPCRKVCRLGLARPGFDSEKEQ